MTGDERVPLGVPDLDIRLGGGVLPGYSVLSMGGIGTGYREFIFTAAAVHGSHQLGSIIPDSVDVYQQSSAHRWPDDVCYLSLTQTEAQFKRELLHVIESSWAEIALDGLTFHSVVDEFLSLSTIAQLTQTEPGDGPLATPVDPEISDADYRQFLRTIGDMLLDRPEHSFIIIDGMTELLSALTKTFDWQEMFFVLAALRKTIVERNTVLLTPVERSLLTGREYSVLVNSFDGVLEFRWDRANHTRRRLMTMQKFRELLATAGEDELAQFELDLEWGGVGIKKIRKIPV